MSSRIESNSADFIICRFSDCYSNALIHFLDGKRSTRKGFDRSKFWKNVSSKNTRQYENNKKLMKYKGREGWERAWNKCMQRSVNLYLEKWGILRFPSLLFNLCTPISIFQLLLSKTVSLVLHKPLSNPVFLLLVHLTSLILLKKRYVFSI